VNGEAVQWSVVGASSGIYTSEVDREAAVEVLVYLCERMQRMV
jgi:hypothetical protein